MKLACNDESRANIEEVCKKALGGYMLVRLTSTTPIHER